jgi:hypothetical protein
MEGGISNLESTITALENIEKEGLIDDPDVREWITQITSEEFELVDLMVRTFVENISDTKIVRDILRVLR